MMDESAFLKVYMKNVKLISEYLNPSIVSLIAKHNAGYARKEFDLIKYYEIMWRDYYDAYKIIENKIGNKGNICDCGGFIGIFALVMSDIGYKVTIVEALKYYDTAFEKLYMLINKKGIKIMDYDLFDTSTLIKTEKTYDFVSAMAIVEHYPYSLKHFIDNLKILSGRGGYIYITSPNIAVLHKRLDFLFRGITPNASIKEIYNSRVPFTGHCHEMTMDELVEIANLSELKIIRKDYSSFYYYGNGKIQRVIFKIIYHIFPKTREHIAILCRKKYWHK